MTVCRPKLREVTNCKHAHMQATFDFYVFHIFCKSAIGTFIIEQLSQYSRKFEIEYNTPTCTYKYVFT